MKTAKILITRRILPAGLEILHQAGLEIDYHDSILPLGPAEIKKRLRHCQGLLSMVNDTIDRAIIDSAPDLKFIANHAVGLDNIDVNYAAKKNIKIGNTPRVLTQATAEIALLLIMTLLRNAHQLAQKVQSGKWQSWSPTLDLGRDVYGKKLGIIGMGQIGQRLAEICHHSFHMPISYYSPSGEKILAYAAKATSLEEILRTSDIVSLHCSYNQATHHLMNAKTLGLMQPSAILINTTRGGVIDQTALLDALNNKTLSAAGLDVTTPEPLAADSPLLGHQNLLIYPHIGSATIETRTKMSQMAATFLVNGLKS